MYAYIALATQVHPDRRHLLIFFCWGCLFEVHCFLQLLLRPQEISENKYLPVLLLMVRNSNIWEAKKVSFLQK